MQTATLEQSACPFHGQGDERKTADAARAGGMVADAAPVKGFDAARAVLRDEGARQAGFRAELIARFGKKRRKPILFLSGEAHRRQRAATARFFAPKIVATRYRDVMERTSDALIARLRRDGEAVLDDLSMELAVTVAADIVGLTESDLGGMKRRLDAFFSTGIETRTDWFGQVATFLLGQWRMLRFHFKDVRPAILARREAPGDDVISHLIAEGYSNEEILTECFTYGAAGMVTTREFITMAAWHLLERPALKARFLAADEAGRIALLEEILRLEPVVGMLYRRMADERVVALDIRAANLDEAAMGACPHAIAPDRVRAPKTGAAGLAFGDGPHRCPGASVAMHEAAVFLDRLLRVPGVRLAAAPQVGWNPLIAGYELRGCRIACDG
ncbi:MAG TPA: cytochrome P450 [Allosphingosinicella sp.]|nr:cytochrome P450 [Allosphingosinicella sp.]